MTRRVSTSLPTRVLDFVRDAGRLHWRTLSRLGRVSVGGVFASALLAVALGVLIPRIVADHALQARVDAIGSLVSVLEQGDLLPPVGDHLAGPDYERFDAIVRGSLLGGENVRVKLWNLAGEIVYSDRQQQVGLRFPLGSNLEAALAGTASAEVSELSSAENRLDADLGPQALEVYMPLRGESGTVVGAFEIYQDPGPFASHLAAVKRAVWTSVGLGLSVLLVFLFSLFTSSANALAAEQWTAQQRAEDLEVLLTVSQILSSEPAVIDRTVPAVLSLLTTRLDLRYAALTLDGDRRPKFASARRGVDEVCPLALSAAQAAMRGRRLAARTGRGDAGLGHAEPGLPCPVEAVAFAVGTDPRGALVTCRDGATPLRERERRLLAAAGSQLGVAVEGADLFADLREMTKAKNRLLRSLVDAQEQERRSLVGDLHDGLGQALTRVLYGLRGSRSRLAGSESEVSRELERLESLVEEQSRNLRRFLAAARPAVLEDFGLARALEAFAREQETDSGPPIRVHLTPVPQLAGAAEIVLFRAAQEAVINARKHAAARHVWIEMEPDDGAIVLEVGDDGRGTSEIRDGIGLTSMKDRVASLGGHVDIQSRPGEGTVVSIRIPLEEQHERH